MTGVPGRLASLRDAELGGDGGPVVSLRSTTGYRISSLRDDQFADIGKMVNTQSPSTQESGGNGHYLNIRRYIDTFEEEEPVDLAEVSAKLVALDKEMGETDEVIAGFFEELGIQPPFVHRKEDQS